MPVGPSNPCLHNGLGAVPQTTEDGAQENKLKEIYCTHATIPEKFSDGTALLQTLTDMISMQVTGGDVPSLRLVRYDGRWYSINNRCLWLLKHTVKPNTRISVRMVPPTTEFVERSSKIVRHCYVQELKRA